MEGIILYGSRYGSTRRYGEELSRETGIPAVSYTQAPPLQDKKVIVYLGGDSFPKKHMKEPAYSILGERLTISSSPCPIGP